MRAVAERDILLLILYSPSAERTFFEFFLEKAACAKDDTVNTSFK